MSDYRTTPIHSQKMPGGIPYIISNEAAERFSFYGMKGALAVFLADYLGLLGGANLSQAQATSYVSYFTVAVYFTPLLGAIIADAFFGKYRTIVSLSIVYCLGHLCLALMGVAGVVQFWLLAGLGLISLGAGGIKPCVSAHVGDQFGVANQHLLTRIFNIFYFSINLGSAVSTFLIPWVLKWHGPHWAFGIPGVLMALATLFFWMGRLKFIHVPAKGPQFVRELFSREGLTAIAKLAPILIFIGMFWCLFDQTATTWIFQAENMDRRFFGLEILPAQIQSFNPLLILVLIPVFTFIIYPNVGKLVKLTPLRKIGAGLFLTVAAFAIVALAQESIDQGNTPHFGWQLLAYLFLTSGEIMVSIVGLEFFYTQAPKRMKSVMMAIFLFSVSVGNSVTGIVNDKIQIPSVPFVDGKNPGLDGKVGTDDDLGKGEGVITSPATEALATAAQKVVESYNREGHLPRDLEGLPVDPWGNPMRYLLAHAGEARIISMGPDGKPKTRWDLGVRLTTSEKKDEEGTWLYREKMKQGRLDEATADPEKPLEIAYTAGGGVSLEGAAYFWFFTKLMLVATILFIPFAILFKTRTYLQDEAEIEDELSPDDIHPAKP